MVVEFILGKEKNIKLWLHLHSNVHYYIKSIHMSQKIVDYRRWNTQPRKWRTPYAQLLGKWGINSIFSTFIVRLFRIASRFVTFMKMKQNEWTMKLNEPIWNLSVLECRLNGPYCLSWKGYNGAFLSLRIVNKRKTAATSLYLSQFKFNLIAMSRILVVSITLYYVYNKFLQLMQFPSLR